MEKGRQFLLARRRSQGFCEFCGGPEGKGLVFASTLAERSGVHGQVLIHPRCGERMGTRYSGDWKLLSQFSLRVSRLVSAQKEGRLLLVTAALLKDGEGRVLVARRPPDREGRSLWEFPGGKLEEGETLEECLAREIREEMEIQIAPPQRFLLSDHDAGDRFIRLFALGSRIVSGEVRLHFHREVRWLHPGEIALLPDLAPADLSIAKALSKEKGEGR